MDDTPIIKLKPATLTKQTEKFGDLSGDTAKFRTIYNHHQGNKHTHRDSLCF